MGYAQLIGGLVACACAANICACSGPGATVVAPPHFTVSDDPWPYVRGNLQRTGANPASTTVTPLAVEWSTNLSLNYYGYNAPLVSKAGWIGLADIDGIQRAGLDGSKLAGRTFRAAADWSLAGDLTATNIYELEQTNLESFAGAQSKTIPGPDSEPILLGDYLLSVWDTGISVVDIAAGSALWTATPAAEDLWGRQPAIDGNYVYIVSNDGIIRKIDLLTGATTATFDLGADAMNVGALAIDSARHTLYAASNVRYFVALDTDDLSVLHEEPDQDDNHLFLPVIIPGSDPPLLLFASTSSSYDTAWTLHAHSLIDYSEQWLYSDVIDGFDNVRFLTADASHIYVGMGSTVNVLDFAGQLVQTLDLGLDITSDVVPANGNLYVTAGNDLLCLRTAK